MTVLTRYAPSAAPLETAFSSVLCGINGSRFDAEVVRQAAALAGRRGRLTLLSVTWEAGTGATAVAVLSRRRAEESVRRAAATARELGVEARSEIRTAPAPAELLVEKSAAHDLLVIGPSGAGRAQGIAVGRTASVVLHTARCPVLIARRPPSDNDFPRTILLAVDGSAPAGRAAQVAARIARIHGSAVAIAGPSGHDAVDREMLARQSALIRGATGVDPVLLDEHGPPARAVVTAAPTWEASLIVIGSRRLRGLGAFRSVSERVAHQAACSVLVAR